MWKLIIIAMLTGGSGTDAGGHIEIREVKFRTESACRTAAYELGNLQGTISGDKIGPYKVRAFCFKYR